MKFKWGIFSLCVFIILIESCKTTSNNYTREPYRDLTIINYGSNTAYEFLNSESDRLAIFINGTGWYSVLGWKEGDTWDSLTFSAFFLDVFKNINFMIPERLNMQTGKYYFYDPETRKNYTLENLVKSYSYVINSYLNEKYFKEIILIGHSEGASLLPLIFNEVEQKEKIIGMIAISYGGLSVYEHVKILADSELSMSVLYREALQNIDILKTEIESYPHSLGEIFGYTYRWWNGFLDYRPFNYYTEIDIPILFIHGKQDIIVPVESTLYIQENLPEKPFEYKYINTDHVFGTYESQRELKQVIIDWVNRR